MHDPLQQRPVDEVHPCPLTRGLPLRLGRRRADGAVLAARRRGFLARRKRGAGAERPKAPVPDAARAARRARTAPGRHGTRARKAALTRTRRELRARSLARLRHLRPARYARSAGGDVEGGGPLKQSKRIAAHRTASAGRRNRERAQRASARWQRRTLDRLTAPQVCAVGTTAAIRRRRAYSSDAGAVRTIQRRCAPDSHTPRESMTPRFSMTEAALGSRGRWTRGKEFCIRGTLYPGGSGSSRTPSPATVAAARSALDGAVVT